MLWPRHLDKTRFAYLTDFYVDESSGRSAKMVELVWPIRTWQMSTRLLVTETRTGSTRNADSRSSHVLRILWRYGVPVRRTDDGYTLRGGMRSLRRLNTPGGTISFIAPPNWKASLIPLLERYEYLASVTMKKVSISGASCLFI